MNTHQHVNEQNDIIQFKIQTLEGNELSVSIQKSEAEKVYTCSDSLHEHTNPNPYDSYGLDFLKEAISKLNGVDPITMQLFTPQGELTTATPLLPLQNQVLSLMIKSPITVTLRKPQDPMSPHSRIYALERNIDFLKGYGITVCYIRTPRYHPTRPYSQIPNPLPAPTIQAVGFERGFFKISIKNLPFHLLRDSYLPNAKKFKLPETPNHLWLRFDKSIMSHD